MSYQDETPTETSNPIPMSDEDEKREQRRRMLPSRANVVPQITHRDKDELATCLEQLTHYPDEFQDLLLLAYSALDAAADMVRERFLLTVGPPVTGRDEMRLAMYESLVQPHMVIAVRDSRKGWAENV
jgi:hypothetical protein